MFAKLQTLWNGKHEVVKGPRNVQVADLKANEVYKFCDNQVITSKYNVFTFLPLFFKEALQKFANTYFLIVSIMQTIPQISTTDGVPFSLFPLATVLFIEALGAIFEDRQRHIDDENANSSIALVVSNGGNIVQKKWKNIVVGEVLKIRNREAIPADCVIIAASDDPPAAVCYVETKSLDGETNLKLRQGIVPLAERIAKIAKDANPPVGINSLDYAVSRVRGHIECETPNPHIDNFDGVAQFGIDSYSNEEKVPLSLKSVLLRGCVVRSTDFVYAVVVNTGHETKIVQSTARTKGKISELDRAININIIGFLGLEFALCAVGAGAGYAWSNTDAAEGTYYRDASVAAKLDASSTIQRFFTYFLLVANMIPISLYVAMKFSRFAQSFFIYWDLEMRYQALDPVSGDMLDVPAKVRTMDLNDSLGQISYIFSDKTGTLTNNIMEFRKFSVGEYSYGSGNTVIGIAALEREGRVEEAKAAKKQLAIDSRTPHPRFISYKDTPSNPIGAALGGKSTKISQDQVQKTRDFFYVLSVCHSVLVEQIRDDDGKDTGKVRLSASSPDDQALVVAAQEFGYRFVGRGDGGKTVLIEEGPPSVYISDPSKFNEMKPEQKKGKLTTYEVLDVLEFTSTRKRMSIIVREPSGIIRLMCKGADSEVMKRLRPNERSGKVYDATNKHLLGFADDGLRTLAIGWKKLDMAVYKPWSEKFKAAFTDVNELDKRKNKAPNAIDDLMDEIEQDLELLGSTAIEDKLQDGVPDTIALLADAGIKIWVLTGDKQETAINIGFACQLLDRSMKRMLINEKSAQDVKGMMTVLNNLLIEAQSDRDALRQKNPNVTQDSMLNMGLVIDGAALKIALGKECRLRLLKLARQCKAVIACRVSPKQKAEVVALVRQNEKNAKTLSIGDGANDVPMIQTAHIGVGISGQEGLQAVNASDYAIAQFRYLRRLLLVHGRNNYRRMSKLVVVMFYKNVMLIVAQLALSLFNGFSGQKFYVQLATEMFNLIYSNLIIFSLAIYDKDLSDRVLLKYPALYDLGLNSRLFNFKVFWGWVINGLYHCAFCFAVPYFMYQVNFSDMWMMGTIVFTNVVFIANLKISLEQGSWHWSNVLIWFFTLLSWPLTALLFESSIFVTQSWGWEWHQVFTSTMSRPEAYVVIVLTIVGALIRDYTWKALKREVWPTQIHIIQETEFLRLRAGGKPDDDVIVDAPGAGGDDNDNHGDDDNNNNNNVVAVSIETPPINDTRTKSEKIVAKLDDSYAKEKDDNEAVKRSEDAVEISFTTSTSAEELKSSASMEGLNRSSVRKSVKEGDTYKGFGYAEDDDTSSKRRSSINVSARVLATASGNTLNDASNGADMKGADMGDAFNS